VSFGARGRDGLELVIAGAGGFGRTVLQFAAVNALGYVDHDVRVGAWSYVGPRATISGFAELGDCVSVGAGATIAYGQKITGNSRLRPGSVTAP
jgi:UDP-3-O-[3-hydroxymyristoyl] glucosamine N-acyltransferase